MTKPKCDMCPICGQKLPKTVICETCEDTGEFRVEVTFPRGPGVEYEYVPCDEYPSCTAAREKKEKP
jgi:hypothetical protein